MVNDHSLRVREIMKRPSLFRKQPAKSPYSMFATRHSNASSTAENLLSMDQAGFPYGHSITDMNIKHDVYA